MKSKRREKGPLVSILIPNYNYGRYLRRCLDSVMNQTYENIEVIIQDNASTDDSYQIILEYQQKFLNKETEKYISAGRNKRNVGSDRNCAICASKAEGKYFMFLSSDDALKHTFVERCVKILENNPTVSMVMVHRDEIDENDQLYHVPSFYNKSFVVSGEAQAAVFMMAGVAVPTQVFMRKSDRDASLSLRNYQLLVAGDWYSNFLMSCVGDVAYIKEPLCEYRVHFGNETSESEINLLGIFEHFVLIHAFYATAKSVGYTKPQQRYSQAVQKLGDMCLRYALKMLQNKEKECARRYLHLALVLKEALADDERYQQLWEIVKSSKEDYDKLLENFENKHVLVRTISYEPPEGYAQINEEGIKMFDLKQFYTQCESGSKVDTSGIIKYIQSFDKVVIWGSAGLGQAIGKFLENNNVKDLQYWDQRYEEIGSIGEHKVDAPFGKEYDRDHTLVIYSIPNHVIMKNLLGMLEKHGYCHVIRGDILYSGILCPYENGDMPSAERCWMRGECRSVICQRLQSITQSRNCIQKPGKRIDLTYNCFIINSLCNLGCTHCVQYMNTYPVDKRINIPVENICRDIDAWLEMIDSVGTISVMGGETFMHPDIAKIAQKFSEHDNFGFVSFPTNGLYPIKPEQLEGIDDPRVVIAFGSYQHVASEKQLEIYKNNIELVKSYGIGYTESRHLPTWVVPTGLWRCSDDISYMEQKKLSCPMPPRNLQIRDGKIHVCDRGVALYAMGVADYPEDYFLLDEEMPLDRKRDLFRAFIEKPYYQTCGHCGTAKTEAPSALQGKIDVFDPKSYEGVDWFGGDN